MNENTVQMDDINKGDDGVAPDNRENELDAQRDSWLQIANDAYSSSTTYMDSSIRDQWERNLYNFHGRDKSGIKKHAAQIFRPKIRAGIRSFEAALAVAMFSNNDLANVKGQDPNNKIQESSAKLNQALLQYRLSTTIPWFSSVIGAYQDTHNYGLCISKSYWDYKTKDIMEDVPTKDENDEWIVDDEGFAVAESQVVSEEVIKDEPVLDLLAPENFRFSPNADWRNPVADSPYLIEMMPMFVTDVLDRMAQIDRKTGQPEWHSHSISKIVAAGTGDLSGDITRQAREGDRVDPHDVTVRNEYKSVWIHFNIIKRDGIDHAFYTIGSTVLLSDPVPLEEYNKLGRKAYTVGISSIEAHRNYPAGTNELGEDLQKATNIIANQRIENVRLVLNKRYFIKRQGNVDLGALMRNVAGGGVMLDDPINDVNVISTPDVTSSSYAEQDRINMDMDEILGTFSPSSVQANRSMNETVGGMNLMSNGANQIQEYMMRIFIETWVEPVLNNMVKLEQMYETDETILMLAANKASIKDELIAMAGSPQMLDKFIQQSMIVSVNVGMGNTNPEQKMQRLMMAVKASAEMPEQAQKTDWDEIAKEIYAYAGFGDGERFMKTEDELKEKGEQPPPPEVQMKKMELDAVAKENDKQRQFDGQLGQMESQSKERIEMAKLALSENITMAELQTKLGIEQSKDKTARDLGAITAQNFNRELSFKMDTGRDGI